MKVIRKIVIDLDDVLNDFSITALGIVGCEVEGPRDFDSWNPDWGFDIIAAANNLHKTITFKKKSFWNLFTAKNWANMPKSEEFHAILDMSMKLVGTNILILTSPICGPDVSITATTNCLKGKYRWIKKHLPTFLHQSFSLSPAKHFCASPDTLLIDDSDENVEKFRRFGGNAILFPRPWNKNHSFNPLPHVISELNFFIY